MQRNGLFGLMAGNEYKFDNYIAVLDLIYRGQIVVCAHARTHARTYERTECI